MIKEVGTVFVKSLQCQPSRQEIGVSWLYQINIISLYGVVHCKYIASHY